MDIYSKKLAKEMTTAILGAGTSLGGRKSKTPPSLGENPMDGFVKKMQTLTGTTKQDRARRAGNQSDDLVKRASDMLGKGSAAGGGAQGAATPPDKLRASALNPGKDAMDQGVSAQSVSQKAALMSALQSGVGKKRMTGELSALAKAGGASDKAVSQKSALMSSISSEGAKRKGVEDPGISIRPSTIKGGLTDVASKVMEGNQKFVKAAVEYDRQAGDSSVLRRKPNAKRPVKTKGRDSTNTGGGHLE